MKTSQLSRGRMYVEFGADEVLYYGSVGFTWDIIWWGEGKVGGIKSN